MRAVVRYLVEHSLAVNLVSIFVVAIGLYAAAAMNREAFPIVQLDLISIDVSYPGATPPEIEKLVITPIEQELKRLSGIDTMLSISFPGSGRITLELDPDAPNRDRIVSDVQLAVERADLPRDLPNEPFVTEIESSLIPIMRLALGAPRTPLEIKRVGDRIRDDLLELPGVAKVIVQGDRKAEIRVTVDPERMRRHRIAAGEIAAALAAWNVNAPGGELETASGAKQVRVAGELRNAADAAGIVLRANEEGGGIRLGDVATVTDTLEEARRYYDVSGEPGVTMLVLKKADADIIATVDEVDRYLAIVPERYGRDVRVQKFEDLSEFTRLRLSVLMSNGVVGVVLVLVTLMLFLRPSVALTTTWGLPIIFFGGLYVLYVCGVTLNLISLFGFIMVLGMLVDDAIVVGENITYHMERGLSPREAAVTGTMEVLGPVTTTVMTTVVAFLPLAFMTGLIGKFVWAIPLVVIVLLLLSWLESFLMLPAHVADVTNPRKHPPERRWLARLEEGYARLLAAALRHRVVTLGLSIAVLAGAVVLARTMPFQLFPPVAVDQLIVRVTAPAGTGLEQMRGIMRAVDREIRARIEPQYLEATVVGTGEIAIDEADPLTQRGSRFGQIRVLYTPAVTRPEHDALDDMRRMIEELPPLFPDLELAFTEITPGPPTGRALEVEISGHDETAATAAAERLIAMLQDVPGVLSVDSGIKAGNAELHVVLDRARAAYAGIDLQTAAQHVRAAVDGWVVSTVRQGTQEVDVTIRYPQGGPDELENLRRLLIPNQRGGLVPLERIGRLEEHPGFTAIRHKNGQRVLRVVADVDAAVITSVAINRLVAERESEWLGDAAGRVRVNYGGEAEKNQESFQNLIVSFAFALIAIFFILAIQFNNLGYPLIVMLAIPFGLVGVVLAFWLHDRFWQPLPLSFMSTMGTVALAGVVVNSAIVLLSFIKEARDAGVPLHEAIVQAGRRRLRAVIVTATTTVVGLLPTAYGWGGYDPMVAPMALALGWGLAFSTFISLFTIPSALA
ncbi:MAG TPA: efflux RND transporter permease subunit, partial [Burkholderiales bacterium]